MNLNDYPKELIAEEQSALNNLLIEINQIIERINQNEKQHIIAERHTDIMLNHDDYISVLEAQNGIKGASEERAEIIQIKDSPYEYRLLLCSENENGKKMRILNVGLHSYTDGVHQFVTSWTMPLCRHYLLDNSSVRFENVVDNTFHTFYTLIVKNKVNIKFEKVASANNLFPGIIDDKALTEIKGTGFFSDDFLDKMIAQFDPKNYRPEETADIISDEFLQELLERRSTPEFKNIVFSIQKKQGEIIQSPYNKNMVVQGCAGSGKSMIMLHRLPIILYDNPSTLSRSNVFVISPSQMYIQLAENMRHQLEISDINMGTIEQYYDYCISKYPGYKPQEYGTINNGIRISRENEQYIFSQQCVKDIRSFLAGIWGGYQISLKKANSVLSITYIPPRTEDTYSQKINSYLHILQSIIDTNEKAINNYYKRTQSAVRALNQLSTIFRTQKDQIIRIIRQKLLQGLDAIKMVKQDLEKLDPVQNSIAIKNRKNRIIVERRRITVLTTEKDRVEADDDYFSSLLEISKKLEIAIAPFKSMHTSPDQCNAIEIYENIGNIGLLLSAFSMLSQELSEVADKYSAYTNRIETGLSKVKQCITTLQSTTGEYLDLDYYMEIKKKLDGLTNANSKAVKMAHTHILKKMGYKPNKNGTIPAIKYSPYILLQILYQFKGAPPPDSNETLLAIDEAQGLAPEELLLLQHINRDRVVMNLYGDVNQHINGTKGIDSWDDFKRILDFDIYEIQENYRNASQITTYCNRTFGMCMNAINTPGKGVHEIKDDNEFHISMLSLLMDAQRMGISAILIGDDMEADYLINEFAVHKHRFHNMTGEEFSIHRTKWNILNINNAKGLEFSSVIVLSGRMNRNQKYIAYTRALDELYIYDKLIDLSEYILKNTSIHPDVPLLHSPLTMPTKLYSRPTRNINDEVKRFFESNGIQVIDKRANGGRLWAIGEKESIQSIVNQAIGKFNISGKYMSSSESNYQNGWCTKTNK